MENVRYIYKDCFSYNNHFYKVTKDIPSSGLTDKLVEEYIAVKATMRRMEKREAALRSIILKNYETYSSDNYDIKVDKRVSERVKSRDDIAKEYGANFLAKHNLLKTQESCYIKVDELN